MPLDLETVKHELRHERFLHRERKRVCGFLLTLFILIGLEAVLFLDVIGGAVVNQSSMSPKVQDGDFIVYNRMEHAFDAGEIVVIHSSAEDIYYIKRVIGLAGDVVDLTQDGVVSVNGILLEEPYVHNAPTMQHDMTFPQTVPQGHIFVLGDNRTVSRDSRDSAIGMVSLERVMGTLLFSIRVE